jgi:membrane-anchored protein YejM (alkaline phosphatase superfamily)
VLLLALLGCTRPGAGRPDIVVVAFEGMRADVASGLPVMQELAQESVVYSRAVTPSPWGLSALASLLTGLSPFEHRVLRHPTPGRQYGTLAAWQTTLPDELAAEGYRTGVFGQSVWLDPMFGLDRGYEVLDRFAVDTPSERVVHEALAFLEASDQPAFALVVLPEPTFPWNQDRCERAPGVEDLSQAEYVQFFAGQGPEPGRRREVAALYVQEACGGDALLGELLEGLRGPHWLVVTSLHGFELWDPGVFGFGTSMKPASVHVPLMIRGPDLPPREESGSIDLRALTAFLREPSLASAPRTSSATFGVSMNPPRTLDRSAVYSEDELLVVTAETGLAERWSLRPDGHLAELQGVNNVSELVDNALYQELVQTRELVPAYPDTLHSVWRVDGELLRELSLVGGRRPVR